MWLRDVGDIIVDWLDSLWRFWLRLSKAHPRLVFGLRLIVIFSLLWLVGYRRLDPDFGWHLQAGDYIRRFGIPANDVFTYTARSFPWIDHEWGTDVLISVLFQFGGYLVVSLVFAGLWTTALFLNAKKLPLPLLWLAAIAVLPYTGIRPTTWTVLGLAILIKITATHSKKLKFIIPLMFVAWANLQGGFIIGFLYLGYLLLKERRLYWGWLLIVCILASFINPYGPRLYVEIARTLFDPQLHAQIKEWSRFYIPLISLIYVIIWASGFWGFYKQKLANWWSFSLIMLAATMSASRNLPLFVVASVKDNADFINITKQRLPKHLDRARRYLITFSSYIVVLFCLIISIRYVVTEQGVNSTYPVKAVAYLSKHHCPGNLFNSYDYGGYLIWKLSSEPVYIDGRMPSWKDPAGVKYLDRYFNILSNTTDRQAEFQEYNIKCALLTDDSSSQLLVNNLDNSGWKEVITANGSILLDAPK